MTYCDMRIIEFFFFLTWSFFARISVVSWSPLRSILFPTSITGTPLQKCLTSFAHCTSTFASESGLNKEWKLLCIADYKSSKENFFTAQITNHPKCEFDCQDIIWLSIASSWYSQIWDRLSLKIDLTFW